MAKPKIKTEAQTAVPQSKKEAANEIKIIGDLMRKLKRSETQMNDLIAEVADRHQPQLNDLKKQISDKQKAVQSYCEANREELTNNGKTKSANLITGEVMWRQRPPSVRIKAADAVLKALKGFKLSRFIRVKEEVNKDAILEEPGAIEGVAGITIVSGKEQFEIMPFEQEA